MLTNQRGSSVKSSLFFMYLLSWWIPRKDGYLELFHSNMTLSSDMFKTEKIRWWNYLWYTVSKREKDLYFPFTPKKKPLKFKNFREENGKIEKTHLYVYIPKVCIHNLCVYVNGITTCTVIIRVLEKRSKRRNFPLKKKMVNT